jgi:TetR/AcrR family transcriptional regulator, tetracycline repressor protein
MPRPKKPLISRDRAVAAGLAIVDERGLDAFTLERLARQLKVSAPSLYHHFADKDDLLAAMAYALLADVAGPPAPAAGEWARWFEEMCLRTYRHVLERPRAATLLAEHFPRTLIFPAHNLASGLLIDAGVPLAEVATVLRGIEKLTFGLILADAAELVGGQTEAAQVSPDAWPAYAAALAANRRSGEKMFVATISLLLAGVAATIPVDA